MSQTDQTNPAPVLRRELHFGDRVLPCYADRPADLGALARATFSRMAEAEAVIDGDRRMTYAGLEAASDRVAGALAAAGVAQGDRVGLLLGNRAEIVTAWLACIRLGAIAVPLNTREQKPELTYVLGNCGAKAVIFEDELADRLPDASDVPALALRIAVGDGDGPAPAGAVPWAEIEAGRPFGGWVAVGEDDTAVILYTSGTTGKPKGAELSHINIVHSCEHYVDHMALTMDGRERSVLAVPATHVTGLVAVVALMIRVGGATVMMRAFKAPAFLKLAEAERMTYGIMVPAMYNLCLLQPDFAGYDLAAWRIGGYGGAPMPMATITRLAELLPGLILVNAYGATETTSPSTIMPLGEGATRGDTVGRPVRCAEIRIMDEAGREVAPGEAGELWIRGPMVVKGYWARPDANAENFVSGFWRSGDIGSMDEAGYVKVFDRRKDMINRGGYKIFSAEVESELSFHPWVAESAIVSRPCPVLGERTHCFVMLKGEGLEKTGDEVAATLKSFLATRLSDYKVPDYFTFGADPLPRNANGKLLKRDLRDRALAEAAA
ncbi:class I adenylate-forming enzyme family protein [Tistrella mobilis]|uniref:class I adenylate-forming enzyme family protein n=1 Tax=Tistrella mobilis TaxID=171437 RepID=UPI003558F317